MTDYTLGNESEIRLNDAERVCFSEEKLIADHKREINRG